MNVGELIAFILYFLVLLAIGQYFYKKDAKIGSSEKEYFLGGRGMGPWVTGLSAQASDMSGWLLMGLPGAIFVCGLWSVVDSDRLSDRQLSDMASHSGKTQKNVSGGE